MELDQNTKHCKQKMNFLLLDLKYLNIQQEIS